MRWSWGGLLAARVLADFYRTLTVVERDVLPDSPAYRQGVPGTPLKTNEPWMNGLGVLLAMLCRVVDRACLAAAAKPLDARSGQRARVRWLDNLLWSA